MVAYSTLRSASADMSLEEVVAQLRLDSEVVAIEALGSMRRNQLSSTSDIDLLVVMQQSGPTRAAAPFEVVFAFIEGRPADVIITRTEELARLAADDWTAPLSSDDEALLRWIREGRVLFDRNQVLAPIVGRPRSPVPWTERERWTSWWTVNFALAKVGRYSDSDDARYHRAAQWVMHIYLDDALLAYFTARHLPWEGERAAIAYLGESDPEFLSSVEEFFAAGNDEDRVNSFARIVRRALDPIGGVWQEGTAPISETWEALMDGGEVEEA